MNNSAWHFLAGEWSTWDTSGREVKLPGITRLTLILNAATSIALPTEARPVADVIISGEQTPEHIGILARSIDERFPGFWDAFPRQSEMTEAMKAAFLLETVSNFTKLRSTRLLEQ